jgi:hypothetical protein
MVSVSMLYYEQPSLHFPDCISYWFSWHSRLCCLSSLHGFFSSPHNRGGRFL